MRNGHGFTLIELLVVLVVSSILMVVAVPAFTDMVKNNRLATETNRLVGQLAYGRSEAAKRGVRVSLCTSANPMAATPACDGLASNWGSGWLIFADGDGNTAYNAATDFLLKRTQAPAGTITVTTNATAASDLRFNPIGGTENGATGGGTASFFLCDDRGPGFGRRVDVSPVGRPLLSLGTPAAPLNNC